MRLTFELEGEKLRGGFHLIRAPNSARGADARRWLLIKRADAAARPGSDAAIVEELPNSVASGRDLDAVSQVRQHVRGVETDARLEEVRERVGEQQHRITVAERVQPADQGSGR